MTTGLSPTGIDLGSNNFMVVTKPEILMLIGGSTNSRDAGEIWHMFDQRYHIPVCMSETESFSRINLNDYNSLILPGGSYNELSAGDAQKMKSWIQNGGTLILYKNAATWASKNEIGKTKFAKEEKDSTQLFSYADRSKEENMNFVSGAIFETELDVTHPLCFGYTSNKLPIFKTGISVAESLKEKYTEPVNFTAKPYISGFISDKNLEKLKNAPVVSVQKMGRGKIISYHENMTFRGIWLGTNKLFTNAVFFGNIIE